MTKPNDAAPVATAKLCTLPGGTTVKVPLPLPKPGIVILIHGVNDVGEAYVEQEKGLCQGLGERLDRQYPGIQLRPAQYRVPTAKDRDASDPDAVYFRRDHTKGEVNSPVIPFYWGFREEEGGYTDKSGRFIPWIDRRQRHGEYLDRYGNRLDKDGAKNGGPFANATTTVPDMWQPGFSGKMGPTPISSKHVSPGATRPLLQAPSRHYMVLAAQRLAMLVRMVRGKSPDDTINVVAHSQGCLITLLANAFLEESGDRPIDTLVMNHPPYGLFETFAEGMELGQLQQTTPARLATLQNIVRFMTGTQHSQPAFARLGGPGCAKGVVAGGQWQPNAAVKRVEGRPVPFVERDNRGKVYLYFCPDDQTVALFNVQGIGWQGVPDEVQALDAAAYQRWEQARLYGTAPPAAESYARKVSALPTLGERFRQRCFTRRVRDGRPLLVGAPPGPYVLETWNENAWTGTTLTATDKAGRGGFWSGQQVRITGEALSPPLKPHLGPAWQELSPIDASIAITQDLKPEETPEQGRRRWMDTQGTDDNKNSFHSSIVANAQHSRYVTAYDLAIGQAKAIDDPVYHLYLCLVADWRTDWHTRNELDERADLSITERNLYIAAFDLRSKESQQARALIDANFGYRKTGQLPEKWAKCDLPPLVVSQTLADRAGGHEPFTGDTRRATTEKHAADEQARLAALREQHDARIAADNAAIDHLLRGGSGDA
ncbi:T6SS effector phospholipase Tle3 domain-containing protein [Lysobacter changpingensis]|uniref:T6SS effector phospholipase Tle3 domain-containing protein n=1 Tax=Lysobacter changpingensis TaxID=2792784 RepID=UPI001A8C01BF|nr:DUF3274 domain-containing protein [Lysobacter changpingensis]